jgi:hypothetical protein
MNLRDLFENNEPGAMTQAVTRRILSTRGDLLSRYGVEAVSQAIDDVTQGDDWEEIGSSDVSAYVRYVEDYLRDHHGSREEMADRKPFAETGVGAVREFAPDDGGDSGDDGFDEETLRRMAAEWYNGDEDPRIERALAAAGWEIGQDEGYDDEPGVFVVQAGDVNGNSYLSWPADELRQGVAEASLAQIRDFFSQNNDNTVGIDQQYGKPTARPVPHKVPPGVQNIINKMYRVGKITPQELEILRGFQQRTKIDLGLKIKEEQGVAEGQRRFNNVYDDDLYAVDPKTKEIIAHLGNPYNDKKAVLIKKREHEQQGHLVMSGQRAKRMRANHESGQELDEQVVQENRTVPVVIIGPNNQKISRSVRLAPGTKNPVQSIMRYYARQGLELYSIAGQKVTAGALAEGDGNTCPECGGPIFKSRFMAEEQDACYRKVRSRYKVWPSAYASGALVQCRKKGAANWGTGGKKS